MQQATTPTPAPPTPPAPPSGLLASQDAVSVPTTRLELEAMTIKRGELGNQLENLTNRRRELASQRASMGREEGRDHDTRIKLLDQRSAQLEREILQTDDAIAKALATGVRIDRDAVGGGRGAGTTQPADRQLISSVRSAAEDAVFGALAGGFFALLSIYVAWRGFRRFIWKRKPVTPIAISDQTPRLDQLQQSIDVIALEVERISEAQRFLAKVMNEKIPALGAGAAQPVSTRARDEVRNER